MKPLLAVLLASGWSAAGRAADTAAPIVIEAPRLKGSLTSPPEELARERLGRVPGGAEVVSSTDFARGAELDLADLLHGTPGMFIESEEGGHDVRVSIRGSGIQGEQTTGLAFLLDGVPYSEGDGQALAEDFDLSSIRYAEVYRGANALRYGAATLGGAINLVSATGRAGGRPGVSARFGSFGYFAQEAHAGGASPSKDYYAAASNYALTGFRRHSHESVQRLFLNLGWRLGPSAEDRLYLTFGKQADQDPGGISKEALAFDPTQPGPQSEPQDFRTDWWSLRLADKLSVATERGRLDATLSWAYRDLRRKLAFAEDFRQGINTFASNNAAAHVAYEREQAFWGLEDSWTVGVTPAFEFEPDRNYANLGGSPGPMIAAYDATSFDLPAFFEDRLRVSPALTLVAGMQYSRDLRDFRDRFRTPNLGDRSGTRRYEGFNPKAGLLIDLAPASQAYLNVSRSYQPPSFDELTAVAPGVGGGVVFNPLLAQSATTVEAGTRGRRGRVGWDLSLYQSWVRGELLNLNDPLGNPLGTVNAARTIHRGVEAGLDLELADGLSLEQTYTLNDFRFSRDRVYGHDRIAGIPVHLYRAELTYEHDSGFYAGPDLEWNAARYPVDHANTLFADSYALVGLRMGYKAERELSAFLEVRNLADRRYAATVEPIADARTADELDSFKPGDGRAFYGGLSWGW